MTIDRTRHASPAVEVTCAQCGATGELFNIGAVWHRGAIERCSYFDAAAGPANLARCLHMRAALENLWRREPGRRLS
jgi:hypothetical protein